MRKTSGEVILDRTAVHRQAIDGDVALAPQRRGRHPRSALEIGMTTQPETPHTDGPEAPAGKQGYDPRGVEERWYRFWEDRGLFHAD